MNGYLTRMYLITSLLLIGIDVSLAQSWMPGYGYRKKITIAKQKVISTTIYNTPNTLFYDLPDFTVMIELSDADLIHIPGSCSNKMRNIEGRDISFALSESPATPLSFELESYNAQSGKITCWVKIPVLSSNLTATPATSIYFYYGASLLHDNQTAGTGTWPDDSYSKVWHMNRDLPPATTRNAMNGLTEQNLVGNMDIDIDNYVPGILNGGILLNGSTESLSAAGDLNTTFTISAWIKLNAIGTEQVIATNDSVGSSVSNGYIFKVNGTGNLFIEVHRGALPVYNQASANRLSPGIWYFVTATSNGKEITVLLNAAVNGSKSTTTLRLGAGGQVKIGSTKQHTSYFNGIIDELRILKTVRAVNWLQTEYSNQSNPMGFYQVGTEEYNPASVCTFKGAVNTSWTLAANWQNSIIPTANSDVIIAAGKTAQLAGGAKILVNKLTIEQGASLSLGVDLDVNCTALINSGAALRLENGVRANFSADVTNNGAISLNGTTGVLAFSGGLALQHFFGAGTTTIYGLETRMTRTDGTLLFDAPVFVTGYVNLIKGTLNANNNLTLAASETADAMLLPIENPFEAGISGDVHIQKYVKGPYASPSTARGWRLFSSPVYQSEESSAPFYNLLAYKNSLFVTGSGGSSNGFDPSPLNSATIYTHDQSLPGTLSQKYRAIPNMATNIPVGKGIFVFSRGSRNVLNAYQQQLVAASFSNPEGYVITYTGKVFTGQLTVRVNNKNTGAEGDGFNLLGNPYPAAIKWGDLLKTNLGGFVWMFDPLNNAYVVSDLPGTVIPSGTGFFVRVNTGQTEGSLTFTENAKYVEHTSVRNIATASTGLRDKIAQLSRLSLSLSRDLFEQRYTLCFTGNGGDDIDDNDALKIGEGYVNIAGIAGGLKLAFDERTFPTEKKVIKLYVAGWGKGFYDLKFSGLESFENNTAITLVDSYSNLGKKVTVSENTYRFYMDEDVPSSFGTERLSLHFEPDESPANSLINKEQLVYPNPFSTKFFLKNTDNIPKGSHLVLRNSLGNIVVKKNLDGFGDLQEIDGSHLATGFYIVQIISGNRTIYTSKILRE
jgi:hypothetical protein